MPNFTRSVVADQYHYRSKTYALPPSFQWTAWKDNRWWLKCWLLVGQKIFAPFQEVVIRTTCTFQGWNDWHLQSPFKPIPLSSYCGWAMKNLPDSSVIDIKYVTYISSLSRIQSKPPSAQPVEFKKPTSWLLMPMKQVKRYVVSRHCI